MMINNKTLLLPFIILSTLSLSACNEDSTISDLALEHNLTGNPMADRATVDIHSAEAQLGKKLFFSKSLGGDRDSACATCHHPMLGGGDALSLPIGVGAITPDLLGSGREHSASAHEHDGGPTVPRNAPTTFNIIGWDQVLFHDGRAESLAKTDNTNGDDGSGIRTPDTPLGVADTNSGTNLASAQARFPVTSPEEMKGFNHNDKNNQQIREFLAARLGGYNDINDLSQSDYWLSQFRMTYNLPSSTAENLITEQNIFHLIGEYERSQVFINSPWKNYLDGDSQALTIEQKRGAILFYSSVEEGGAGCVSCHSGDFMTDEQHHNIATPQLGRGKGDGSDNTHDFGRYKETFLEEDRFAFRTPSLLNVEVTGPWTHAGAYSTLEATIRHHLNPSEALINYDFSQLSQAGIQNLDKITTNTQLAVDKLTADQTEGKSKLAKVNLTDKQVNQLTTFLKSLTDPCVKSRSCMTPWIPDSVLDADPNGDLLMAVDQDGVLL